MGVKEDLEKKVPDFVKATPEWSVFLKWISQKKVKTVTQLKSILNAEIKECETVMKKRMPESRLGTSTRIVRRCAKELDFLKLARNKIVKYL